MENSLNRKLQAALTGALGFTLGGIAGVLAVYLISISGVLGWLLGLIPEEQGVIRLWAAIILPFVLVAFGGAVSGVINGLTLHRIDPQSSRKRYTWSSTFAFGVSQGIVIIPMLLLLALISLYNNGYSKDPRPYVILAGLFGLIYGLLCGAILSLLVVRLRYTWLVFLAALLGFLLGGAALGFIVWRAELVTLDITRIIQALILIVVFTLAFYATAGIFLGLVFDGLARKRAEVGSESLQPARWQVGTVLGVSLLVLFAMMYFQKAWVDFLTRQPGTEDTLLITKTTGVHWYTPIGSSIAIENAAEVLPDIDVNERDQGALAWTENSDEAKDVFLALWTADEAKGIRWTEALNISASPGVTSEHAQTVIGVDGDAHVVWAEYYDKDPNSSMILYSRCTAEDCSPPVVLSDLSNLECAAALDPQEVRHDWPAIALNGQGSLIVTWSAGQGIMPYSLWSAREEPPQSPSGCVPSQASSETQPQLVAGVNNRFYLTYATRAGDSSSEIYTLQFDDEGWHRPDAPNGIGNYPQVFADQIGQGHVAWCGVDGQLQYQRLGDSIESIAFPGCLGRPVLAQDVDGLIHLMWYAEEVRNNLGIVRPKQLLYESIRSEAGWLPAAIIADTRTVVQPSSATGGDGTLFLTWSEGLQGEATLYLSRLDPYECSPDMLNAVGTAMLDVIENGGFYPAGYQIPYCQNEFFNFVYMPNPDEGFTDEPATLNGGFDRVAELARTVEYEALFTTMQWDPDEQNENPGSTYANAIADLYRNLKDNPERYPRGLTVRIMLGNYPELANMQWGDQIWDAITDIRQAGVEEMVNQEIGWQVEVANYSGTYPHSHTKFIVVDGIQVLAAGFNYGWLHYPSDHPSGKGDDLVDLGMLVIGPVAQSAMATYDDMWEDANQIHCTDFYPEDGSDWRETCQQVEASVEHVPEVKKYYLAGDDNAFSLFRSHVYKESDETVVAAISNAQETIYILEVNFSGELICYGAILAPELCTWDNALPWMKAIVEAIEKNQVQVRAIVENANANGLENRIGIQLLENELARRGLSEYFEARFFNGRVHAKSLLIDDEMLVVGSQNFHYSAYGESGLLEYNVATDSLKAIQKYQDMYEYYWDRAIPSDEAFWTSTGS